LDNAAIQLAGIAEAAGQIGVGVNDIEEFSRVIAMLGMATTMTTDELSTSMAQFMNITGTAFNDVERLGDALVHLGNNGASTEQEIMNMSLRLAAAGRLAGLADDEIMALASGMASLGIRAEAGGTAMSTVLKKISEAAARGGPELERFAAVARMSAADFAAAWNEDPVEAFQAFLAGFAELGTAAQLGGLEDMEFDGIRVSDMLLRMASNTELVNDQFRLLDESGGAAFEEASKRAETTAAQINRLENNVFALKNALGQLVLPTLNEGLESLNTLFDIGSVILDPSSVQVAGISEEEIRASAQAEIDALEQLTVATTASVTYTVQSGDTVWSIALEQGVEQQVLIDQLKAADLDAYSMPVGFQFTLNKEGVAPLSRGEFNLIREEIMADAEAEIAAQPPKINVTSLQVTMQGAQAILDMAGITITDAQADSVAFAIQDILDSKLIGSIDLDLSQLALTANPATASFAQLEAGFQSLDGVIDFWNQATSVSLDDYGTMFQIGLLDVAILAAEGVQGVLGALEGIGNAPSDLFEKVGLGEIYDIDFSGETDGLLANLRSQRDILTQSLASEAPLEIPATIVPAISPDADPRALSLLTGSYGEDTSGFEGTMTDTGVVIPAAIQPTLDYTGMTQNQIALLESPELRRNMNTTMTFNPSLNEVDRVMQNTEEDVEKSVVMRVQAYVSISYGGGGGGAGVVAEARAAGGPISAGNPYLVGENGPELIVPSQSGYVIPNGEDMTHSAYGGGGGGMVIQQVIVYSSARDGETLLDEVIAAAERRGAEKVFAQ
jgi:TP901 family phage tail tape measure protein